MSPVIAISYDAEELRKKPRRFILNMQIIYAWFFSQDEGGWTLTCGEYLYWVKREFAIEMARASSGLCGEVCPVL